ncbi:MAG: Gfo/Idh/MocA family oxidoreductase [Armatimonadota bacterium]|nr:Gfo/Idh/MocA family oxidoreductase [Armatimonadota bacterium]MCX7776729.1 Gfo/Idh/MocA family oxidoreductase [Armatimonadota bacterium]MDW8025798.1 Gfo/Idh/MocA family oxidoreductase [Armatimonadota bacterium]
MPLQVPLRVGCIGLGIGKVHLQCYSTREDVRIAAVCDINEALACEVASTYGAAAYTSAHKMLSSERLDAVSICTPPKTHAELVEACAEAKVHVLCEKPMASNLKDCRRMIEAAEGAGIILMVAHKKRFHPFYSFLKRMCDGEWGQILWASVRFALGRVEKGWFWDEDDGGGPVLENAVHVFDLLRWLMGEAKLVFGFGGNLFAKHRAPQIDSAAVCIQFSSGGIAALAIGYASEWAVAREQVAFATPFVVVDADGPFDNVSQFRASTRDDEPKPIDLSFITVGALDDFANEIEHFIRCVLTGVKPLVDGYEGMRSVKLALAAKHAIRTGQVVDMERFECD